MSEGSYEEKKRKIVRGHHREKVRIFGGALNISRPSMEKDLKTIFKVVLHVLVQVLSNHRRQVILKYFRLRYI